MTLTTSPRFALRPKHGWLLGTALVVLSVHTNWDVPIAAWLFPIFLLRYARQVPLRRAAVMVWVALLIGQVYWLAVTGLLFVPAGLLAFGFLSLLQTVPFLADRQLARRLGALGTLVFPVTLVAVEYLFTVVARFGDYGALGSTQSGDLPLLQLASVTGVYGLSFILGWFASVVNTAWSHEFSWRPVRRIALVHTCVLAVVFAAGGLRLVFGEPDQDTVRLAGISPSARADGATSDALAKLAIKYWRPEEVVAAEAASIGTAFAPITDDLLERTRQQALAGAKIVVWPETHASVLERDQPALLARAGAIARETGAYIELAYALYTPQAPNIRNVAVLVDPAGQVRWTYDKTHPTPMEPMEPGPGTVPSIDTPYGRLATVICYDADYPALMRQDVALMLVPADDWSGFERLHAENATFRAVENGYSVFRQATHGISTAVDSQGRVLAQADYFRTDQQTLVADVPLQPRTATIYSTIGDVFAWLCLAAALALGFVGARRTRSQLAGVQPGSRPR